MDSSTTAGRKYAGPADINRTNEVFKNENSLRDSVAFVTGATEDSVWHLCDNYWLP